MKIPNREWHERQLRKLGFEHRPKAFINEAEKPSWFYWEHPETKIFIAIRTKITENNREFTNYWMRLKPGPPVHRPRTWKECLTTMTTFLLTEK